MAFVELGLNRVELAVRADNRRALRSYARRGFRVEGRRRQAMRQNGHFHDMVLMSMLRDEYLRESAGTPLMCHQVRRASRSPYDLLCIVRRAQGADPADRGERRTRGRRGGRSGEGRRGSGATVAIGGIVLLVARRKE